MIGLIRHGEYVLEMRRQPSVRINATATLNSPNGWSLPPVGTLERARLLEKLLEYSRVNPRIHVALKPAGAVK